MSIKVSCTCGKKISAKDEFAGRQVKCPACKKPLRIPKPKVEEESYDDEWNLDDYGEDEADAQPVRPRSTNKPTKSRGSKSRKSGRKSASSRSKPNLLLGLSAGGGILLVVVLVWMLWPSEPDGNVANNSTDAEMGESTDAVGVTAFNPNTGSVSNGDSENAIPNVAASTPPSDDLGVTEPQSALPKSQIRNDAMTPTSTRSKTAAVAAIEELGGQVSFFFNVKNPVKPLVGVNLRETKVTDANGTVVSLTPKRT
ncbi:MAG: hypothetical protein ACKVHE_32925 [Planctomycetales bacterium]|jgi:hypothetical protein